MGSNRVTKSPASAWPVGLAAAFRSWLAPLLGLLLLAASQALASPHPAHASAAAARGRAFAQRTCSGCHEIGLYGSSSNPNSPPFGAIANQEGLTAATLSHWLRGAHNYPMEMNFLLHDGDVDALVAYFLSLRVRHYRRPADL